MHNKVYNVLEQIPATLGTVKSEALTCFISGIVSAQLILEGITLLQEKKFLDILALVHLNYQNLGSSIESIPFEIRNKLYKELKSIFGINASGGMKSWITRSACAHLRTFSDLDLCHTPEIESMIIAEATLALETLRKAVANFHKTGCVLNSSFIEVIIAGIAGSSLHPFLNSTQVSLAAVHHPTTKGTLFQNCIDVLDVCFNTLPNALIEFQRSLPAQALAILTFQFIGENIRLARAYNPESVGKLNWLREKRTKIAHQYHMFEQGADDPDTLYRAIHDLRRRYLSILMQKAEVTKTVSQARAIEEEQQTEIDLSAEAAPYKIEKTIVATKSFKTTKVRKEKVVENAKAEEFPYIEPDTVLSENYAPNVGKESFKGAIVSFFTMAKMFKSPFRQVKNLSIKDWNEIFIYDLMLLVINWTDFFDGAVNVELQIEICEFILQHLELFTGKNPEEFLTSPITLYPNGNRHSYHVTPNKTGLFSICYYNRNKYNYMDFLEYTIGRKAPKIIEFLLKNGANPNVTYYTNDGDSYTLFGYCLKYRFDSLALTVLHYGGRIALEHANRPILEFIYTYNTLPIELLETIIIQSSKRVLEAQFKHFWYNLLTPREFLAYGSDRLLVSRPFCEEASDHLQPGKPAVVVQKMIMHLCKKFDPKYALEFFISTIKSPPDIAKFTFLHQAYKLGLNKVANLFRNILTVLDKHEHYPLHYSVLLDEDITDSLTYLSAENSLSEMLGAKPVLFNDTWLKLYYPQTVCEGSYSLIQFAKELKNTRALAQIRAYIPIDKSCNQIKDIVQRRIYLTVVSFLPFDAPRFDDSTYNLPLLVLEYCVEEDSNKEPAPPLAAAALIKVAPPANHIIPSASSAFSLCNTSVLPAVIDKPHSIKVPASRQKTRCEQLKCVTM